MVMKKKKKNKKKYFWLKIYSIIKIIKIAINKKKPLLLSVLY